MYQIIKIRKEEISKNIFILPSNFYREDHNPYVRKNTHLLATYTTGSDPTEPDHSEGHNNKTESPAKSLSAERCMVMLIENFINKDGYIDRLCTISIAIEEKSTALSHIQQYTLEFVDALHTELPKFPVDGNFYMINCSAATDITPVGWEVASFLAKEMSMLDGTRVFADIDSLIVASSIGYDEIYRMTDELLDKALGRKIPHLLLSGEKADDKWQLVRL